MQDLAWVVYNLLQVLAFRYFLYVPAMGLNCRIRRKAFGRSDF